jgi:hypothetical protein
MTQAPSVQTTTRTHRTASRAIGLAKAILAELADRPMFDKIELGSIGRHRLTTMSNRQLLAELVHCCRQLKIAITPVTAKPIGRDCLERAAIAAYQANQAATGGNGAWGMLPESEQVLWLTTTEAALLAAQNKTDSS